MLSEDRLQWLAEWVEEWAPPRGCATGVPIGREELGEMIAEIRRLRCIEVAAQEWQAARDRLAAVGEQENVRGSQLAAAMRRCQAADAALVAALEVSE